MIRIIAIYFFILVSVSSCTKEYETTHYDSGVVKSKRELKNGVREGTFFTYYENGNLKSRGTYRLGKLEGKLEWFYEGGELEEVDNYTDGLLTGESKTYYANGDLKVKAEYKNDQRVGTYIVYDRKGLPSELSLYDLNGNLYYFAKWGANRQKDVEAFTPVFNIVQRVDSTLIFIKSNILFSGKASLRIGLGDDFHKPIVEEIAKFTITDTTVVIKSISKIVDVKKLYYQFSFVPSESDTILEFNVNRRLIRVDSVMSRTNERESALLVP